MKSCRTCRYNRKCLESDRGYACTGWKQYTPAWVRARQEQEELEDAEAEEADADKWKLTPADLAIGLMLYAVAPICCGAAGVILRLW